MKNLRKWFVSHMLACVAVASVVIPQDGIPVLSAQEVLAIHAKKIITGVSREIEDGTVVIKNGRIVSIGQDVDVPFEAKVYRFPSGVVVPGLIEPDSQAGLRVPNENLPVVPYLSVMDGIDPTSESFKNALRDGVTAIHVLPGNAARFGGQGAVVRPFGATVEAMVIKSPSAMKLSLQPTAGENLMTHMAALRRDFLGLYRYLEGLIPPDSETSIPVQETAERSVGSLVRPTPDWSALDFEKIAVEKIDRQKKPLVDLVQGKMRAFIYCPRASDVFKAFEIMDVHGIRATLVLGPDAHRARDVLAARKDLGLVVLGSPLEYWEKDPDTGKERRHLTARLLYSSGIRFALRSRTRPESRRGGSGFFTSDGSYHLWYQAAILVRQGIPREEALRSVTLNPAKVLGLDHRMGTLEPEKDANLAVFTGDPLDVRSWVDRVFIEGREVYRRDVDRDLQELLRRPERKF